MGIDATMVVRGVPATRVSNDQLKRWSFYLCVSIGAENFLVAPERGQLAIERTGERYQNAEDPPAGTYYGQDGPEVLAEPGECMLEIHVWSRWYGVGYERGDLLTLCAVAEWVEQNIPGASVWYGGDSSGVYLERFDEAKRRELKRHLYSGGGRAYFRRGRDDLGRPDGLYPDHSACKACPEGNVLDRHGWGNGFAAYSCPGCGRRFETKDDGKSWQVTKP